MAEPFPFEEAGVLQRHAENPLLTAGDVPYPSSLFFNAGVAKYEGRYVMIFRNDYGPRDGAHFLERLAAGGSRFDGTSLGLAFSEDGIAWDVRPVPTITLDQARDLIASLIPGKDPRMELERFYDPRLSVLDGRVFMCFAIDTAHLIPWNALPPRMSTTCLRCASPCIPVDSRILIVLVIPTRRKFDYE